MALLWVVPLRRDGAVITWDHHDCGGWGSEQHGWRLSGNITDTIGCGGAFAATRKDGSIVVRGTRSEDDGVVPLLTTIGSGTATCMEASSDQVPVACTPTSTKTMI